MANFKTFPKVPRDARLEVGFVRKIMLVVNTLVDGKTNNTGEVTLTNGATSLIVEDIVCQVNSTITLTPVTSDAANVTGIYIQAASGQFTINHVDPASTTATFRYVITG